MGPIFDLEEIAKFRLRELHNHELIFVVIFSDLKMGKSLKVEHTI